MEQDFTALIRAIQEGPLERKPWAGFTALLRETLGANYADLVFRRADAGRGAILRVKNGVAVPAWVAAHYKEKYFDFNPIPYFEMHPGRAYSYEELEGISELGRDPFRHEFLRAADCENMLIFRVTEPSGCNIWVTVIRSGTAEPFGASERALCERLAGHLSPALACHAALLRTQAERQIYQRALHMLAFGVITLDGEGRVVSIDEAAQRRIEQTKELTISRSRLRARGDDHQLQTRIRDAIDSDEARLCHVGRLGGLDLMIIALARRPDSGISAPRVLIYLSGRTATSRDMSAQLAGLFDLTHTQARLAMLLAKGQTLADAADVIGITEQTARTYSKAIYQRTGTSRQGELIQRILTSVAMLG